MQYSSDRGWLFESINKVYAFQIDESLSQQIARSSSEHYFYENTFSKIQYALHYSSIDKYQRTFPKIQSMLANITGLIQVSFQFSKFLVNIFTLGQYYSFFFEIEKIKNIDRHHSPTIFEQNTNKVNIIKPIPLTCIPKNEKTIYKKKVIINALSSFQWMFLPRINYKTKMISNYQRKITLCLSVENIVKKLYTIDYNKMIELFKRNLNYQNCTGLFKTSICKDNENKNINSSGNELLCTNENYHEK